MEGEGPTYTAQRTIQPSQEDQLSIHAVQKKVLFVRQLEYRYLWIDSNNTLINKMHLTPLLTLSIGMGTG